MDHDWIDHAVSPSEYLRQLGQRWRDTAVASTLLQRKHTGSWMVNQKLVVLSGNRTGNCCETAVFTNHKPCPFLSYFSHFSGNWYTRTTANLRLP